MTEEQKPNVAGDYVARDKYVVEKGGIGKQVNNFGPPQRSLARADTTELAAVAKKFSGTACQVMAAANNVESSNFAKEIWTLLKDNGWDVGDDIGWIMLFSAAPVGVQIMLPGPEVDYPWNQPLGWAFVRAGFDCTFADNVGETPVIRAGLSG